MASIGSGHINPHVQFNDEALLSGTPETPNTPVQTAPKKSILKSTAPVEPPSKEQLQHDLMRAKALRTIFGASPQASKPALEMLFAAGRQQSSRLKPEMKATPAADAPAEDASESPTQSS